jgi:hypothetical protein
MPPSIIGVGSEYACPFLTLSAVNLAQMIQSASGVGSVGVSVQFLSCNEHKCALWDLGKKQCALKSLSSIADSLAAIANKPSAPTT